MHAPISPASSIMAKNQANARMSTRNQRRRAFPRKRPLGFGLFSSRLQPVLHRESRHATEFALIVGHYGGADVPGMCGDQHIVRSDRLTLAYQRRFYFAEILSGAARQIIGLEQLQHVDQCSPVLGAKFSNLDTEFEFRKRDGR